MIVRQFTSYHIINRSGVMVGRYDSLITARQKMRDIKVHTPEEAPYTLHRAVAAPMERMYANSGTIYNPLDARTRYEKRIQRGA